VTEGGGTFPAAEVGLAAGAEAVSGRRVESGGYGRVNAHWRIELADGRTAFVKHALTDDAVTWLRIERLVYESVLASLAALRTSPAPPGLPSLEELRLRLGSWVEVADDPEPLLRTGLCSRGWLEQALPHLMRAVFEAELGGDELLHLDVRSDNICFLDGRVLLVDWNLACTGNGEFDVICWLPSLHLEGGPAPWELLPDAGPLAAVIAGYFASRAGLPPPPGAPTVREFQRAQAEISLPWAARELGLPAPL
jgi:hypothetical protein